MQVVCDCGIILYRAYYFDDPTIPELYPQSEEVISSVECSKEVSGMAKVYAFFLLSFQSVFHISDTALSVLLSFMVMFVKLVVESYGLKQLETLSLELPSSVADARKLIGGNRDNFSKFGCCPACSSIYPWTNDHSTQAMICSHIITFSNNTEDPVEWK